MLEQNKIFDREFYKIQQQRLQSQADEHSFIFDEIKGNIVEKLRVFYPAYKNVLNYGHLNIAASDFDSIRVDKANVASTRSLSFLYDEENPTLENGLYNLIISGFTLHLLNNIKTSLSLYRQALRENGVFAGVIFGGKTLYELREACSVVDINYFQGLSPRVMPMIEMKDTAKLLQLAGFKMPVADIETVMVTYSTLYDLLLDVRGMGQGNCLVNRNKKYPGKHYFKLVEKEYFKRFSADEKIIATFDIITFIGKK